MSISATDAGLEANRWLRDLESCLNGDAPEHLATLFRHDGSWRDVLAISGGLRTADGREAIVGVLKLATQKARPVAMRVDFDSVRAESALRYGIEVTEVFFDFVTEVGEGKGIARLAPGDEEPGPLQALTLLTAIQSLVASTGRTPSLANALSPSEGRFWAERRAYEIEYAGRDPAVLIVGAGQAGLATGAWLKALGIDTLLVEKWPRIGDNWRNRYEALKLHNDTRVNHLPFIPFPDFYPRYIPKDKVGNWFEFYADALELNVWTETTFKGAVYDPDTHSWTAELEQPGGCRVLRPRHIVVATGVSGIPRLPDIEGLDAFHGTVVHTTQYTDGSIYRDRRVLVIGTGTSGHDTAQDLYLHGAAVTMMQRSKTIVTSIEPAGLKLQELYLSGRSTEESDLIAMSATYPMQRRWLPVLHEEIAVLDHDLLEGLKSVGFEAHYGDEHMGLAFEYRRRGGGYYIDVGCSRLLIDRKINLVHAQDLGRIVEEGLLLRDGSVMEFDVIVLATGYKSMGDSVRNLFGDEIADRVGPIWGLDNEGEIRNICRRTAQEGLWFMAGGFPETRIYSRPLALQIQAAEAGVAL